MSDGDYADRRYDLHDRITLEDKMKTLEQAAIHYVHKQGNYLPSDGSGYQIRLDAFVAGAQWERERSKGEIEDLVFQRNAFEKAAQDWMKVYDRLKEKYEPLEAVVSRGEP